MSAVDGAIPVALGVGGNACADSPNPRCLTQGIDYQLHVSILVPFTLRPLLLGLCDGVGSGKTVAAVSQA